MSQVLHISLDYSELMAKAKASHSAFTRGKNGRAYLALSVFLNDAPDKFGNDVTITLNSAKAAKDKEGTVYVGHGQTPAARKGKKINQEPAPSDDLPF
jgi:hypothetical protein